MEKSRKNYVDNVKTGNIVAFKVGDNMFSGKIVEIEECNFVIRTKNSSIYFVKADDIVWVKNGSRWPQGIYNALKYTKQ